MRPIDADSLMDDVMERYCKDCDKRKGIKSGKWKIVYEIGDAPCRACSVDDMKAELEDAPTIEERKKGKWETVYLPHEYMGCAPMAYYCSECSHITTFRTFYCPNCGADMRTSE